MYKRWLSEYSVSKTDEEIETRLPIFKENVVYINNFNKKKDSSFTLKINQFADNDDTSSSDHVVLDDNQYDDDDKMFLVNETGHFNILYGDSIINNVRYRNVGIVSHHIQKISLINYLCIQGCFFSNH
ncbi:hypothetical protein ACP275_04G016100 [Erythranthe tilingii]